MTAPPMAGRRSAFPGLARFVNSGLEGACASGLHGPIVQALSGSLPETDLSRRMTRVSCAKSRRDFPKGHG